jgi:hypothetical protein
MPVAAQVFQVWWYALNEDKVSEDADFSVFRTSFPDIVRQDREEQKPRLRRKIEKFRNDKKLLADPATENWRPIAKPSGRHSRGPTSSS